MCWAVVVCFGVHEGVLGSKPGFLIGEVDVVCAGMVVEVGCLWTVEEVEVLTDIRMSMVEVVLVGVWVDDGRAAAWTVAQAGEMGFVGGVLATGLWVDIVLWELLVLSEWSVNKMKY